jgi:UDP-N-acetylglucosamine 2-epimerase (non-hydrolysing)
MLRAFEDYPHVHPVLIHTGQHYDENLSGVFFEELGMKNPDVHLEVGSGKQGAQTARVLERMEHVLENGTREGEPYHRVLVVGDVNSTMASALAAAKLGIPVAHVEAGLRSFDRTMPEEINRLVTDALSDMLFVSEPAGMENLCHEGHPQEQLFLTGNVMIDTLNVMLPRARSRDWLGLHGLRAGGYAVVTLHRPANVDDVGVLSGLIDVLIEISEDLPIVFPIHPRTVERLERFGLRARLNTAKNVKQLPPMGYLAFLALTSQAKVIVTDSGGLQEESTALGIPCLTTRNNTERPITVEQGTSTLVGSESGALRIELRSVLDGSYKQGKCPALWDGRAAQRIAAVLAR